MNASPPVLQVQPSSDAVQPNAPASAATASTRAGSQDFAAALCDAGGKPARKSAMSKQHDTTSSGSALPAPGNALPPALPTAAAPAAAPALQAASALPAAPAPASAPALPAASALSAAPALPASPAPSPAAKAELLAAAQTADAAGAITGPPGGAVGPNPSAVGAAPGPAGQANTGNTALPSPANLDPAALPVSVPSGPSRTGTAISAAAGSFGPTGTRIPAAPAGNAGAAKSSGGANQPPPAASATATTPTDGSAPNGQAAGDATAVAGTDAAAQAAMAAAMQSNAPSANSTLSAGDSAPSDAGPQGVATLSDPAAGSPAAALAKLSAESTAAAVTAATAASVAQVVLSAASAGAADKRHSNGPDTSLSGASNDGSAGAALLLTSNASTDSSPSPSFKVAAGVDTAQFGQGVADRVSMMMDGNLTSAKLQVNPPALGPIEVRIALQAGHAQVWLSSHSAVTRDALESTSSKLQEMLSSQGFSQVSVDISQRSFQERSPQSQAYEATPFTGADAPAGPAPVSISRSTSGLLDAYA